MTSVFNFFLTTVLAVGQSAGAESIPVRVGVFQQEVARTHTVADGLPDNDVLDIRLESGRLIAVTKAGAATLEDGKWSRLADYVPRHPVLIPRQGDWTLQFLTDAAVPENGIRVRQCADNSDLPPALATERGLFVLDRDTGAYTPISVEDNEGRAWAAGDVRGTVLDAAGNLWFAVAAGVVVLRGEDPEFFTGAEGLPYNDFTCMAAGADGSVWMGTTQGAIRFKDGNWHYRQGRRWLPDDHVRAVAVTADGNAWFATDRGVGMIGFTPMTLAEKAAYYEAEMDLIRRTPFGYVSEVTLATPGDKSNIIYTDSDNDGLWTSMYGAGACFAYAATGDPLAKDRATRAFEALRFLQKVTQTGDIRPPKGYVARTILPTDGPDPNVGRMEGDIHHRDTRDSLWKIYEPRWPKSGDGKWYWKSDTSSDELDGHYFFYPAYYDLVAESEEEKERVREVVRDLTDHLLEHGFNLVDFDGTPTRWGIYSPDRLNKDPNWWPERGLKSLSMLSYLAVAEHVTGDPKYGEAARDLIDNHGYLTNAMIYKIHFGPGSGNQSDDEMAFMSFYNLVKYTRDERVRHEIMYSFYAAFTNEFSEMNPLFNFCYAAFGRGATYTNPWGTHDISPWDGWLADSIETLKDFPLDRISWGHNNSHRIDIRRLPRQQASEPYEPHRPNRGHRVNGKVLPVSERFFHHWNTDPWSLDYSGNGNTLGSGTVFLLPYYMGLYHGFIAD